MTKYHLKHKYDYNMNKYIVTSALIYTNNVPHLGNIIGSVLSADVYSRYLRLQKYDVTYIGGVDEYGTATEIKASEKNMSCKELCDINYELHKNIYDWFLIKFDCYGRTSQPNGNPLDSDMRWPHTRITTDIYKKLCDNNLIVEKEEHIMFCPQKNEYVADRYVIATCPYCRSQNADGDQCDKCGKLLDPTQLIDPKYKLNLEYKLELKKIKNLHIDIDKVWKEKEMDKWFENNKTKWSRSASTITQDWLKKTLESRSITRDLKWGTRVPDTTQFGNNYSNKVFYVWFDAPIGYISITENTLGQKKSEELWNDKNTTLVQFMAKDNVPFHSIIFPVTLRGSNYSNIENVYIYSTDYLLYENNKFSKSKNKGLFCDDVIKISQINNLKSDYWRAYLIYIRPENSDSNFVLNDSGGFVDFINNILLKNVGNLIHRVLSITYQINIKYNKKSIFYNKNCKDEYTDIELDNNIDILLEEYHNNMKVAKLSEGLKIAFKLSTRLNIYINEKEPWNLIKNDNCLDRSPLAYCIYNLYKSIIKLAELLQVFMPTIANDICNEYKLIDCHVNNNIELILPIEKPTIMINPIKKIIVN